MLLPAKLPMYKLDFSENSIRLLEARPYFNNTIVLDMSNAQLENVTEEALEALQKIDRIYLHDNLLTTLARNHYHELLLQFTQPLQQPARLRL